MPPPAVPIALHEQQHLQPPMEAPTHPLAVLAAAPNGKRPFERAADSREGSAELEGYPEEVTAVAGVSPPRKRVVMKALPPAKAAPSGPPEPLEAASRPKHGLRQPLVQPLGAPSTPPLSTSSTTCFL
jgi:hypothetical protein